MSWPAEKWSLAERPGWLRLKAFQPLEASNLFKAGNTLTQRTLRTNTNEVTVKLNVSGMTDGQKAGFTHFRAPSYATLGVLCEGTDKHVEFNVKGVITNGPLLTGNDLWLKSTWGLDGKSQFAYSLDGRKYIVFGATYQLQWGSYRGDRIGLYSYNDKTDAGYLDVDFFHYTYGR